MPISVLSHAGSCLRLACAAMPNANGRKQPESRFKKTSGSKNAPCSAGFDQACVKKLGKAARCGQRVCLNGRAAKNDGETVCVFHGLSFLCMGWEKGGILGAMAAAGKFAWDWAGAKRVGLSRQSSLKETFAKPKIK